MNERLLKLAKSSAFVAYPLFYLFCLMIFAAVTFPYEKLKQRIVASFNADQRASGGQTELSIESMGGYWLSGVRMRGVSLLMASTEVGTAPTKVSIDQASVRRALLPMLVGHADTSFDVRAFGGEASGWYDVSGDDESIDVTLESLDLGMIGPLTDLLGVPIAGTLGGTVRLKMPGSKLSKSTGQVSLEAKAIAVGDGKAKIKGAFALPRIELGTLTLAADAKEGLLKITKFVAGGRDMDVQGEGRITLRDAALDSLGDVQVRFRINDAYREKSEITKTLFGSPGSSAPALFELADPKIKQSKRADGFYAWAGRGPLRRLDFTPAGGSSSHP